MKEVGKGVINLGGHHMESKNIDTQPRTYTIDDIVKILQIGRTTAYNLANSGQFKVVRIGSTIRISKKAFDAWLDEQE